jgi:hypothetical protein
VSEAKLSSYGGAYVDDVRGRKVVPVGRGPGDLIGKVHGYMTQAQEPALWCTKQTINPRLAGIQFDSLRFRADLCDKIVFVR